jgi:hypothetical protein
MYVVFFLFYEWKSEFYSHKPNTYSYREAHNNIHILDVVHVWKSYSYINQEVRLSYLQSL